MSRSSAAYSTGSIGRLSEYMPAFRPRVNSVVRMPSFSISSPPENLPPYTPMLPVMVLGSATIVSAPAAT